MMRRTHWIFRFLLLMTALTIVGWWLYSQVLLPDPVHLGADPQIPYMLSSLSPFKGEAYTFIDHPGTPVELAGTFLLALTYPFMRQTGTSFVMTHISDPGMFLGMARTLLVGMSLLTLVSLATRVLRREHWTDDLAALSLAVLFFAIYPLAFDQIVSWSHNSFAYPLGALLGLGVIMLFRDHAGGTWRRRVLLGAVLGMFTAIQIYFVTWLLGAILAAFLFVLLNGEGMRKAFVVGSQIGLAAIGGFVLSTLPIVEQYGDFARWILAVSSHQGRHGSGAPGFLSIDTAANNLLVLVNQAKVLFIGLAFTLASLAAAFFRRSSAGRSQPALWACALGFLAQLIVMLALVVKHPGILYLQAVAVSIALLLSVTLALLREEIREGSKFWRMGMFGMSLVVFVLFAFNVVRAVRFHHLEREHVRVAEREIAGFIQTERVQRAGAGGELVRLWVYGTPSDCHALWYGNRYADRIFSAEIGTVCPKDLTYDLWERQITLPDSSMVPLSAVSWDALIAYEAALLEFPHLNELGQVIYSEFKLGPFGRIVYILNS